MSIREHRTVLAFHMLYHWHCVATVTIHRQQAITGTATHAPSPEIVTFVSYSHFKVAIYSSFAVVVSPVLHHYIVRNTKRVYTVSVIVFS